MTDNPKCETCRWWHQFSRPFVEEEGWCRAHPPGLHHYDEDSGWISDHPKMHAEDWCGEHSALRDEVLWLHGNPLKEAPNKGEHYPGFCCNHMATREAGAPHYIPSMVNMCVPCQEDPERKWEAPDDGS